MFVGWGNGPNLSLPWYTVAIPEGPKHHYIPVFYQKAWCGVDRRLCEYSRPHHTVIARRKFPTETGFERGLYTLNAHTPAVAEIVENRLMRQTDQYAALAHRILLRNDIPGLGATMRSGWPPKQQFLNSVKRMGRRYRVRRGGAGGALRLFIYKLAPLLAQISTENWRRLV